MHLVTSEDRQHNTVTAEQAMHLVTSEERQQNSHS